MYTLALVASLISLNYLILIWILTNYVMQLLANFSN